MKTQFRLLVNEVTGSDELQQVAGRVFDVYLTDADVHHHLCSFQPSLWCVFIGTVTEHRIPDGHKIEDILYIGEDTYFRATKDLLTPDFPDDEYTTDEEKAEFWEDSVECLRSNTALSMKQFEDLLK